MENSTTDTKTAKNAGPGNDNLRQIIHRHFLASALLPLLVIETVLLGMYFGVNLFITDESTRMLREQAVFNLDLTSRLEAEILDNKLSEASRLAQIMQEDHQRFFSTLASQCVVPTNSSQFRRHENGATFKSTDNGGASLYYAANTHFGPDEKRKALCSEALDPLLKSLVETSPIITQAYLNTRDDMNRLYPFMKDAPGQYGPSIHMTDYNFYYLADAEHNPSRGPVWTEAYLDPAGLGWMASVIVPVYHNGRLEGVSGLDVTIDTFVSKVLNLNLPWNGSAFLVDSNGVILAMPEQVGDLLGLQELRDHVYDQAINHTVTKPEDFNLGKIADPAIRQKFIEMFAIPGGVSDELPIQGTNYIVHFEIIAETGWRLVTLVGRDEILGPVQRLRNKGYEIGFIAIAGMIIFYALFFLFLMSRSRDIAKRIVAPLDSLSEQSGLIGRNAGAFDVGKVGIREIDHLSNNFNHMKLELDKRAQDLVDATVDRQIMEKEQELLARLASRDGLTNLFNRRKIEEGLIDELSRANRYKHGFGLILLDVDHFKAVNDSYGHATGDDVLQDLGILLQEHCRSTDIPGRWGGEEFIILCPEADVTGLQTIAEKIRVAIEQHNFEDAGKVTASLGLSLLQPGEDTVSILQRADEALYAAKNAGRNRCVLAPPPAAP